MTTPLMMIGPGGDYVTRFDVKGDGLIKTRARATAGHDRDAESSGGSAAWGWLPRRGRKRAEAQTAPKAQDQYQHTEPAALPATYAKPGLADLHSQFAMLQVIEHWLTGQQDEIDRLAAIQTVTEADLARTAQSQTDVRVIRWNGGTMKLPTPARPSVPTPVPCHSFADDDSINLNNQQPNPERSAEDGQPQPHAQADEDPYDDSRHPALQRLFADDARARRSFRSLKGHGLRARRGLDQKGLPDPRPEQGALFGAVA